MLGVATLLDIVAAQRTVCHVLPGFAQRKKLKNEENIYFIVVVKISFKKLSQNTEDFNKFAYY